MALPKVASLIADRLNASGVEWMATGSVAAMVYGEYRVTNDIDVVLILGAEDVAKIAANFPLAEFYCPPADVLAAEIARTARGHFNLIHHETGFKADVYLATDEPLTHWALARRQPLQFGTSTMWLAPPEYVVIGKLEFFREGGSEKHIRDIRAMLAQTDVDLALLEGEIKKRRLEAQWQRVRVRG